MNNENSIYMSNVAPMRYKLNYIIYGCIIGYSITKHFLRTLYGSYIRPRRMPGQVGYQKCYDDTHRMCLCIFFYSEDPSNSWLVKLPETARDDLSIRQWQDIQRIIEKKYLREIYGAICSHSYCEDLMCRTMGNVPETIMSKLPAITKFVQNVR